MHNLEVRKDPTKIMAELLKSGAVMLAETCPVEGCVLPLFKLRSGEIVCPVHGRVYIVKTDEEMREVYTKAQMSTILEKLELQVLKTIETLTNTSDVDPTDYIKWLEVLERIQRLKSLLKSK
ncbi:MAG: Sjogren's syndrome/scleroderma autoantigen 1 family protein [Desulfurococcaceae archaeon]